MFSAGTVRALPRRQGGYTIIEVMIVLIVMSALFVSAAILVGGRQNKVEFSQAVNDIKSALQQQVNQVGSGYYARTGALSNLKCKYSGSMMSFQTGSNQGESTDCIFMGQAIAFGVPNPAGQQRYITYTLAGKRVNGGLLATANPKALAPGSVTPYNGFPDASVSDQLHNGLRVQWMRAAYGASNVNIGGFAMVSSLGAYANNSLQSGATSLDLIPVTGYSPPQNPLIVNPTAVVDAINANLASASPATKNPANGIQICFMSGGTQQSALVTIGGAGGAITVDSVIKNNTSCA